MGVSLQFENQSYLSSKEAGRISGYTSDYISRLARQGKVAATRIGTQWFVEPKSLDAFLQFVELEKENRKKKLSEDRHRDRVMQTVEMVTRVAPTTSASTQENTNQVTARGVKTSAAFLHIVDAVLEDANHAQKSAFGIISLGFAAAFIFVFGGQFLSTVPSTKTIVANAQYTAYGLFNSIATPSAANVFSVFGSSDEPTRNIAPENTVVDVPKMDVVQGGIVVLPGATSRATIDYVKQAFSDDVSVKLDADKTSGVITPTFSEGGTEAYRFVVVPVRHMP